MGWARPRRTASTPAMSVVATAPMPGIMTPNFPVAGLMLAAASVGAAGVDMLGNTLLCCNFSVRRKVKYLAVRVVVQTDAVFMRALAVTQFCVWFANRGVRPSERGYMAAAPQLSQTGAVFVAVAD